jgi:hypothetical protein
MNEKQSLLDTLKKAILIVDRIDNESFAEMRDAEVMTLKEWVEREHKGNQSRYAAENEVHKQQVSHQLKSGAFIVVNGDLYRKSIQGIK